MKTVLDTWLTVISISSWYKFQILWYKVLYCSFNRSPRGAAAESQQRVGKVQEGLNISPKRVAMADLVSMSGHGGTRVVAAEGNESDEGQVKLDVVVPYASGNKRSTNGKITLGILLRVSCVPLLPCPWYASTSILSHRPGSPDRDLLVLQPSKSKRYAWKGIGLWP